MTNVIPGTRDAMLTFYANHVDLWSSVAAQIGVSSAMVIDLKGSLIESQAALQAAQQARETAKVATDTLNFKAAVTRALGGAAMSTIRAFAESAGGVEVYQLANIPAPKPPQPAGPPTPALDFTADPRADGTIQLRWKGTIAQNASFDIERSVDGGAYTLLKNTRSKKYLDTAVPMNSSIISYRIYGVRDDLRSTSISSNVLFGTLPPALQAAFRTGGPVSEAA